MCALSWNRLQDFRENVFYDVSTWHVPSAFDLAMHRIDFDLPTHWLHTPPSPPQDIDHSTTSDGFAQAIALAFSPLELPAPKLVAALQRAGGALRVAARGFTTQAEEQTIEWPAGTFVLLKQANASRWERLVEVARGQAHVSVRAIASSLTPNGPDLGSDSLFEIPKCRPLLVMGRRHACLLGWSAVALSGHPDGTAKHECQCGRNRRRRPSRLLLRDPARRGPTAIGIKQLRRSWNGTFWMVGPWSRSPVPFAGSTKQTSCVLPTRSRASHPEIRRSESTSLTPAESEPSNRSRARSSKRASTQPIHSRSVFPIRRCRSFVTTTSVFPMPKNSFQVAAQYSEVIAGYVSQRNRERLRNTAAAWVVPQGQGRYVLLADNPVFRGFVRGSERFLTNAILLGPAIDIPSQTTSAADSTADHHHAIE